MVRGASFERDLRRLNDVLSGTPLAGRYWVCGGLLLGWARDGRVLDHDAADADFGLRSEDVDRFHAAVPALERAGFARLYEFANNEGVITQYSFKRNGALFEFFLYFPGTTPGERRFFAYGMAPGGWLELEGSLPDLPLERFRFLRCEWLKPSDHERVLTLEYGEWRTPNPDWDYVTDDAAVIARRPWLRPELTWR